MNKQYKALVEAASAVRLEEKEKSSIKASLISFIDSHPLPEDSNASIAPPGASAKGAKSIVASLQDTVQCFAPIPLLFGVLLLFLASATALVGRGSEPGDLLFPLKKAMLRRVQTLRSLPHRLSRNFKKAPVSKIGPLNASVEANDKQTTVSYVEPRGTVRSR